MIATHTKGVNRMERKRSDDYVKHVKILVETAESELYTPDGRWISVDGLNRLKRKMNAIKVD
jgi:hypothetical protein